MLRTAFRFLGRERELDALRRRLEATLESRGGVMMLTGPPGIGTTSVAVQAVERARAMGMAVAWGESRAGLLDRPFGALASALEGLTSNWPPGRVLEDVAGDGGPILRICPALAEVLPTLVPAVPLDPLDERLRLREALHGWLSRMAAREPLLIVLDEHQLADGDLRAMVEYLAGRLRGTPVLLLCVATIGSSRRRQRAGESRDVLETIELDGLDVGAIAALLGGLSDRPVMPATVELVHRLARGNPLHSAELYRHLIEEELLPGPGSSALPAPAALPQTLAQVVAWRVARLPVSTRAALNVLAAFDRGASAQVVAAVAGAVKTHTVEALEALVAQGLVSSDEGGARYAVMHPAIRAALLDGVPALLRAQMQRRIAEVVEIEAGDERRQVAGELAFRWSSSEAVPGREKGLSHFLLAAEQARAAYAHMRAVDCLRAALTLVAEDAATSFDLTSRLAVAESVAGLRQEALASTRRVLEIGSSAPPAHGASREPASSEALSTTMEVLRLVRGEGMEPSAWPAANELRIAAAAALGVDRSPRSESLPHARFDLLGEAWQPLTLGGKGGIDVLAWTGLQPHAASVLAAFGAEADKAETMLVQRPRGRAETAAAAEAARTWRRPPATLRALACVVTDLVTRQGMFTEALGWASQYLATAERYGSLRDRVRAAALLARCHTALGDLEAAAAAIERAEALLPGLVGTPSPAAEMLADELTVSRLALAHFVDGDWPALLASLPPTWTEQATPRPAATPQPASRRSASGTSSGSRPAGLLLAAGRCLGLWRAGDGAAARKLLRPVIAGAAELPPLTLYRDAALTAVLAAAWEMGAGEQAANALSLVGLARDAGVGAQVEASLELTEARMLGLAGRVPESRATFDAARAALTAAGMRPQVALADHDEAIVIAAAGPHGYQEATRLLTTAGERFDRLGMRGWSDRVSGLLIGGLDSAAEAGGRLSFTYARGLSRHEADLVRLVATGATLPEAATELALGEEEANRLLAAALKKLAGKSIEELPQLARRHGLGGL